MRGPTLQENFEKPEFAVQSGLPGGESLIPRRAGYILRKISESNFLEINILQGYFADYQIRERNAQGGVYYTRSNAFGGWPRIPCIS